MPDTNPQPKKNFFDFLKDYIALAIVIFSFVVLIILLVQAFSTSGDVAFGQAKDLVGLFLPLIGTWMGTILAFYFTKENFESASRSMQQTISRLTSEEKLKTTKVSEVMIEASKIDRYLLKEGETWDTVPVVNYIDFLDKIDRQRLVIFEEGNKVKYVIHKSILNSYVYVSLKKGKTKEDIDILTLADLLADDSEEFKKIRAYITNTVDFVNEASTLYEAQQKMNANAICQDIFVTSSGTGTEPIKGWVTNAIVTEKAKI
jgi:hypothetical protein